MSYCAGCGKEIKSNSLKIGKLSYHSPCIPVSDVKIAPVIPIRRAHQISNRAELLMLRDLAALLSMTNDTPIVVVPWKKS